VRSETWISVDVETSGPTPGTGSLLAIGACLVDRPEEGIELLLRPDPALPWSDEAEAVHGLSRERLAGEGLEPRAAMERLAAWLERVVAPGGAPVFVGFNAPFDWMFVAEYAWRHLGRNPFGISALDLKALYLGRHLDEVTAWAETTNPHVRQRYPVERPHTHGALDDAREQAEMCRRIRDSAAATAAAAPPVAAPLPAAPRRPTPRHPARD
jgi:ribonuclease T